MSQVITQKKGDTTVVTTKKTPAQRKREEKEKTESRKRYKLTSLQQERFDFLKDYILSPVLNVGLPEQKVENAIKALKKIEKVSGFAGKEY